MHFRKKYFATAYLLAVGMVAYCQPLVFTDVANSLGIQYSYNTPSSFGGGVSFHDWNKDGSCDISFGSASGDGLYIFSNTNGIFNPVNFSALSNEMGNSRCVLWADIDNDGDKDLFVINESGLNKLYKNEDNLTLTDVSIHSGLSNNIMYSYSACIGDYDNDGWLDLYVVNRNLIDPTQSHNKLFRNKQNAKFEDVTKYAGVADSAGLGFSAVFFDYNNDGRSDLYIANDKHYSTNKLFHNIGDGRFEDVSHPATTGIGIDAMGITVGDYDDNGYLDLYVTNTPLSSANFGGNVLLSNHGNGTFSEVASQLGVSVYKVSWGANFADFDNDGDLDLFVASGQIGGSVGGNNNIFVNQGNGTFVDDLTNPVTMTQDLSFGSSIADFDDDGCYDIAVMNGNGTEVNLWKNQGNSNNFIKLTLEGRFSNKDGIGVRVHTHYDGHYTVRYTQCGSGYGSQSSDELIVGLGQSFKVDSIVTFWPSGVINSITNVAINTTHHLVEDTSCHQFVSTFVDSVGTYYAKLNWEVQNNPSRYRIRGKEVGTNLWLNLTEPNGNAASKVVSYLKPDTKYNWQVRAICNAAGTESSAWTKMASFTTLCEKPSFISSSVVDSSTVKLSWELRPGAAGYQIDAATSNGKNIKIIINDGNRSDLVLSNVDFDVTYKWKMRTICNASGTRLSPPTQATKINISNVLKNNHKLVELRHPGLVIYPNPSAGQFIMTMQDIEPETTNELIIYNASGAIVLKEKNVGAPYIGNLDQPAGTYMIHLKSGHTSLYSKLILFR